MATVVQYEEFGGPDVLHAVEVETPTPGAGRVLVEVRAVGVNPIEGKLRQGLRPSPPITTPRRLGSDAAGVIVAVGDDVSGGHPGGFSVGDEVIVRGGRGTYATHVVASPEQLVAKPAGVSWKQGAALGIPIGTAYQVVVSLGVERGSVLLIHGGSGAVGRAAIQFAVRLGARVLATTSDRNADAVRALGAEPIAYGDGLLARVRAAAPEGVDLILDAIGTDEAIETSLALVDDPQRIGTIVVGGRAAELGIRAWSGGNPVPLTEEELALRADAVAIAADLIARGEFVVEIGPSYPLDRAADAHRESAGGHAAGKIVLIP